MLAKAEQEKNRNRLHLGEKQKTKNIITDSIIGVLLL
jgi:hypothetical protein